MRSGCAWMEYHTYVCRDNRQAAAARAIAIWHDSNTLFDVLVLWLLWCDHYLRSTIYIRAHFDGDKNRPVKSKAGARIRVCVRQRCMFYSRSPWLKLSWARTQIDWSGVTWFLHYTFLIVSFVMPDGDSCVLLHESTPVCMSCLQLCLHVCVCVQCTKLIRDNSLSLTICVVNVYPSVLFGLCISIRTLAHRTCSYLYARARVTSNVKTHSGFEMGRNQLCGPSNKWQILWNGKDAEPACSTFFSGRRLPAEHRTIRNPLHTVMYHTAYY